MTAANQTPCGNRRLPVSTLTSAITEQGRLVHGRAFRQGVFSVVETQRQRGRLLGHAT